jgi:hypothetical protein
MIESNSLEMRLIKEVHLWRSLVILLLVINLCASGVAYLLDVNQHASDNALRAQNWAELKGGILKNYETINANFDRQRLMTLKNYEAILRNDEHLRQCSGCHSHPKVAR